MKNFVICLLVLVGIAAPVFAQEFTTAQVLAKLDEKAKVFSSLEADLSSAQVVADVKAPPKSGKLSIKMANGKPRLLWDVTVPKGERMTVLIDKGLATAYFRDDKTVKRNKVDENSDVLQLLVLGFGVPAATINKNYSSEMKGGQSVGSIQAVLLELRSMTTATARFPRITLYLDPQTWNPIRTRVFEKSGDYNDYTYSNIKLNKGVQDSVFNLKIPSDVK
jgi:outer membrane lipoprotein-sorting protein